MVFFIKHLLRGKVLHTCAREKNYVFYYAFTITKIENNCIVIVGVRKYRVVCLCVCVCVCWEEI